MGKKKGKKAGGKKGGAGGEEDQDGVSMAGTKRSADEAGGALQVNEEVKGSADADVEEFEDAFEDQFEEEEVYDGEADVEEEEEDEQSAHGAVRAYVPGVDEDVEDGEMVMDPSAYLMFHALRPEWPCLSFDFLKDSQGMNRTRFPYSMMAVAGTQAPRASDNKLQLMRLTGLQRLHRSDDSDDEDDSGTDDEDQEAALAHVSVAHSGGVNRVRAMQQKPGIVASWADTGHVHVWDLTQLAQALERGGSRESVSGPCATVGAGAEEGFALDWSGMEEGNLLCGDVGGAIRLAHRRESGWTQDGDALHGHRSSVEDLQWSPTEATVFASASADKTVAVWDLRRRSAPMISVPAHEADVNVLSWNPNVTYLLVSGGDEGTFKVWDLRTFGKEAPQPVAQFTWHKQPVTSVEWHPTDESMLAVSSADNQVTIWDLSVEEDEEAMTADPRLRQLPPQLLFIHQGQQDVKELHWHRQVPGVLMTTAADGFNVFKPATVLQGSET
jgi:ribosome assembly protein RRB1